MDKGKNLQEVSQSQSEFEISTKELNEAISMMDEVGFESTNLKKIVESTIPLDQAKIPYKLFVSQDGIRIAIDETKATRH